MLNNKKIFISLFIIALVIAAVLFRGKILGLINNSSQPTTGNMPASSNVDQVKQQEFYDTLKKSYASDQDMDGLLDGDESKYKTSPTSSDTDNDGLSDWQEINIYQTSPIKADDDGDGYADGYEVRRGFNPKGEGKLIEVKQP